MISPNNLANFLDDYLETAKFADEPPTVYRPFGRSVTRLGLVLEPWPGLADWVRQEKLDALFIHRPYKLEIEELPEEVGVLASHLPFEERLALGFNPRLADALGMTCLRPLGNRKGRPLGMVGNVAPQTVGAFYKSVFETFGGREDARTCERNEVTKVAVVGAMTAELMREASEGGAEVYITGQMRQPGREAILDTGLGVIIVGHRRSEEWALRVLAHVLRERFFGLCVCLPKEPITSHAPMLPKQNGRAAKAPVTRK
jgi:putative NIF3 family GTP cyclohydrolase 1 type 2